MKCFHKLVLWLAAIGLVIPQLPAAAAGSHPSAQAGQVSIADVALTKDGLLRGQAVDRTNTARAGATITVYAGDKAVGETKTDALGNFAVRLNKGGVYQVTDGQSATLVRVWTDQSQPPAAKPGVLLVSGGDVTRGQLGGGALLPYIFVGAVVTGIAVAALAEHHEGS
jgi:hypothetical protein